MKLERLHEYILITVVLAIGVCVAAYVGKASGQGQTSALAFVIGGSVAALIGIQMRARVWLLIPLTSMVLGKALFLPLPFSVQELGVLFAFGWYLIFTAVKIVRNKPSYGLLDFILFLNLTWVLISYIRNPVGVDAFGSDRVGGRPYFATIVSMMAYWVLCRADFLPSQARIFPFLLAAGTYFDLITGSITHWIPATVPMLAHLYSGITLDTYTAGGVEGMDEGSRLSFLGEGGITTIMALCSYFRPMTIINPLYIWRFFLMALSMVFVFCSGFRGNLIVVIVAMIIGTYFRKRSSDLVTMTVIGIPLLAMTIAMNGVLFHLPLTAQRALSFLPGNWDANAKLNADDSTEWRVFMWKTMLNEKKYLKNRWLGDGFGYSREEWVAMQRLGAAGSDQENLLIVGQVHSGPLTAIRYVGIVGFALYMLLVIMMAVENWRLIRRCYGTPFFATAVFNGMTIIFFPFSYVVMFGSYDGDFPRIVFLVGLLKLLRRGITDYEATQSNPKEAGTPANALRPELLHA